MELKKELNPQQIEAVLDNSSSLLVFAGAGSGKTRVLTFKIAYLIREKNVDPFKILAITFTNKAASEMKKRIIALVGNVGQYMWVSTFHSFCARLLRKEISKLGFTPNFVIYDSEDSLKLISRCIKDAGYDTKMVPPKSVQEAISATKNMLRDSEDYSRKAFDPFEKMVAHVFRNYEKELKEADALDFDDLLLFTVNLFKEYPDTLGKYQQQFEYILVDEFQDTNLAQNELILMLFNGLNKVFVVGDDDQSIYSWRGAQVKNIINFDKNFDNTKIIKLEQNYRSTSNILSAANELIKNNYSRSSKKLWTSNPSGELIIRYRAQNEQEEAKYVAEKILKIKECENKNYKDFAVFYRTNAQSRVIEETFMREKIPYRIFGGLKFYDRKEIKDMLAYLKFISNPNDFVSLQRIINVPARGIGKISLDNISKYSFKNNITFCEAFYNFKDIKTLNSGIKAKIRNFIDTIELFSEYSQKNTISQTLEFIWEKTGYIKELNEENTIDAMSRIENLRELLTVIREFEERYETTNSERLELVDFLQEIALISDIDNFDENADTVILMTLHNAKGLEFDNVFIIGMEEGIFPHIRSITSGYDDIEEERRLCYVGMTRAKSRLIMTSSIMHFIYGDQRERLVSRFIGEIPKKYFIDENPVVQNQFVFSQNRVKKDMNPDFKREKDFMGFALGDIIEHKLWGDGEILRVKNITDDLELDIAFKSVGLKKLLASIAPIKKKNS
ncbi:MAG TPA: ATP-dependent DNA helicase PcrA [Actinobacteria bacterium]|nr:ATP-dependent DNA helicase PcrA [Actinomycetota bacterium]